jgi:hypothetical protein
MARGHIGPWTTRPVDTSTLGQLGPWTHRPLDNSARGYIGPWTTRPVDTSALGQLGLWTHRPLDNSARGHIDPWTTRIVDTSARTLILDEFLKGHSHKFSRFFFYSLQCIINIFLIIRQNACVIRQVKRLCKHRSTHLYRHLYSMQLRYSISLPFKSIFG